MNIEWLNYFVTLAEIKNFSSASKKLCITPSTLSKAINQLENEFKQKLIIRTNKFERLTPAGQLLFENSKNIVRDFDLLSSKINDLSLGEPCGEIRLQTSFYYSVSFLAKFILKISKLYPKIKFIIYDNASNKEDLILNNKIDLAFVSQQPKNKQINFFEGKTFKHIIVSKNKGKTAWSNLEYIVPLINKNDPTSSDGWDNNFERKVAIQVETVFEAIKLCEAGLGALYIPSTLVEQQLKSGLLHIVSEPPFIFEFKTFVIYSKSSENILSIKTLLEHLKEDLINID